MTPEQHPTFSRGMNADQEIRAAAIQGAAALCEQGLPMEDVLFVADVFAAYIAGGWQSALEVHSTGAAPQEPPKIQSVELREQSAPPPVEPAPVEAPPAVQSSTESVPESLADILPLSARGAVTKTQVKARTIVERTRFKRAAQLLNEGRAAKAEGHRQRVLDAIVEAELDEFVLDVGDDGGMQQLGAYLRNLWNW